MRQIFSDSFTIGPLSPCCVFFPEICLLLLCCQAHVAEEEEEDTEKIKIDERDSMKRQ